jgi:N-acetylglucosaminyl-diphospho-decaprenol L-rhamnosyltransferase
VPTTDDVAALPRWAAVVVNYESGPLLLAAVESLTADDSAGPAEVVVVDNGSSDGSAAAVRSARPEVRVLTPGENVGYARAANLGIAATAAPVVVVCNPDLVQRAGTAAALLARLDAEPDLAAVGPQIHDEDGEVYPSARSQPPLVDAVGHALLGGIWPGNPASRRYRQLDAHPDVARDVDWISGASIWLRRSALRSVGGWDEGYFMYVEDVDLCWRLRRLGWRVAYEPAGLVVHVQGASTRRHPYRSIVAHHRSLVRFADKRLLGWRRALLPVAATFLWARCAFLAGCYALTHLPRRR